MLIAGALTLVGIVIFFVFRRRWEFSRWGIILLPVVPIISLRNLSLFLLVFLGSIGIYAGFRIGRDRFSSPLHSLELRTLVTSGIVLISGLVALLAVLTTSKIARWEIVLWIIFSGTIGYGFFRRDPERRWFEVAVGLLGVIALMGLGVFLVWLWMTPPVISQSILGFSLARVVPRPWLLASNSDVFLLLRIASTVPALLSVDVLSLVATAIGSLVFLYVLLSMVGHISYTAQRGIEKVDNLTVVLVTIASEEVRDALMEAIEHNRQLFEEYEFRVLIDEGAELQPELEAMEIDLVVVPDDYDPAAVAKGRAMQYFIETHVVEDRWYAFLDDDNLVQGREFLYEIPQQEAEGIS